MGTSTAGFNNLKRLKLDGPISVLIITAGVVSAALSISMAQKLSPGPVLLCVLHVFWLARVSKKTFRYMLVVPAVLIMATVTIIPIVYLIWVNICTKSLYSISAELGRLWT